MVETGIHTIGAASRMVKVCPATLRIWESKGLLKPNRLGKDRYYSDCDIELLKRIKKLLQAERLNVAGVKALLSVKPCWEIKKCPETVREKCEAYIRATR